MKITQIEINNFRNITHSILNFENVNIIEGKNHIGKTNILLAIYWLLSGKLLDGSSDDISLKQIGNTNEKVSVEIKLLTDDGKTHSIKKTYCEKWTATRGSEEMTLTGHETKIYIDEIEQSKLVEAKKEIDSLLKINNFNLKPIKELDWYQLLMNPLYAGEILDWKSLRELIISIIGDVSNQEVFDQSPNALIAKELLEKYEYKSDKAILYCKNQLTSLKDNILSLDSQIENYRKVDDVEPRYLEKISNEISEKLKLIDALKNKKTVKSLLIDNKKKELNEVEKNYYSLINSERDEHYQKLESKRIKSDDLKKIKENKENVLNSAKVEQNNTLLELRNIENKIENLKIKENSLNEELQSLRESYKKINQEEFKSTIVEIKCSNCGHIINADALEKEKEYFENNKQSSIAQNVENGKRKKLECESIKKEIEQNELKLIDVRKKYDSQSKEIELDKNDYTSALNDYEFFMNENFLNNSFIPSDQASKLFNEIEHLKNEIYELSSKSEDDEELTIKNEIDKLKVEIDELKRIEGNHYIYLNAQEQINKLALEKKSMQKELVKYDSLKSAISNFNLSKLNILEQRIKDHFGEDVSFVLIEKNLKDDSWSNVCYPIVNNSNAQFKNASTSEKVMCGIQIIETFKRELGLPNIPIIIDEIGELDSYSIDKLKEITSSQIIASRVNDNFEKPNLKII